MLLHLWPLVNRRYRYTSHIASFISHTKHNSYSDNIYTSILHNTNTDQINCPVLLSNITEIKMTFKSVLWISSNFIGDDRNLIVYIGSSLILIMWRQGSVNVAWRRIVLIPGHDGVTLTKFPGRTAFPRPRYLRPGRCRKSPLGYFCTLNNTRLMAKDKE